jgi:hypothetical protein
VSRASNASATGAGAHEFPQHVALKDDHRPKSGGSRMAVAIVSSRTGSKFPSLGASHTKRLPDIVAAFVRALTERE